jgi:hypothetical protein
MTKDDWTFIQGEEEKISWWQHPWKNSEDVVLVIWPDFKEDGTVTFCCGHSYNDDGWYEFEVVSWGAKTLQEAKEKILEWSNKHDPEEV